MIQLDTLQNTTTSVSLTATIETALCVGAGGSSGSLADKPIVRTADGRLLLPASQLKGRLRHECEKLTRGLGWHICESPNPQTMCPQRAGVAGDFQRSNYTVEGHEGHHCLVCQIFGNPTLASRILFDDLICTTPTEQLPPEVLRPGVTINRSRHTAEEKKLYWLETSPAAQLQFAGKLHLQANCPSVTKLLLRAALHHIHALGGSKSTGLGWLQWEVEGLPITEQDWNSLLPENES